MKNNKTTCVPLQLDKDELYVLTAFRYPDLKRTNPYAFRTKSWLAVGISVLPQNSDLSSETTRIRKLLSSKEELPGVVATYSYLVSGTVANGRTDYVFPEKRPAHASGNASATFSMQGTLSATVLVAPHRDDVVFVGNRDSLGRNSLTHFDPVTSRRKTIAVLPTIAAYAIDDDNLAVSNGVDVFIFSLADLALTKLMPRIFGDGPKDGGKARKENSIVAIYIDSGRMLARAFNGKTLVFDLTKD
jgi:hypothetical protein